MQPDSMISRAIIQRSDVTRRAAHVGRRRPDSLAGGERGFELANVELQRLPSHGARPEPSGKRVNSGHARIPVRPQRVVKMTFASSSPPTPAMQSSLRDVISGHGRTVGIPAGLGYNLINGGA